MKTTETLTLGTTELTFETGELARQAHGALVVRHGASMVLATVVAGPDAAPGPFLPLTVDYRERMSAAGRIPGGYLRREARMSDHEVLTSRLIDRALRPRFARGLSAEVQVAITVFGADPQSDLESLAILAACGALHLSDVPFDGPIAGLRVCTGKGGDARLFVSAKSRAKVDLDLVVCADRDGVVMLEGRAHEASRDALLAAIARAADAVTPALDAFDRLRAAVGRPKRVVPAADGDGDGDGALLDAALPALNAAWDAWDPSAAHSRRDALEAALAEVAPDASSADRGRVLREVVRARAAMGQRLDGRTLAEVRPISATAGYLAATHGSALFTRGRTQALVSTTLGASDDGREHETVFGKRSERFMLHYNFPAWAVGEARAARGPGRRELGHGALARAALLPVLPPRDELPWAIRVLSDVLESDGSSSMATVSGASLSLFDAGVPLRAAVGGVAMGMIATEGATDGATVVLTDLTGDEDALGDMDLKLAGTRAGFNALQLDNKRGAIPADALAQALDQGRAALDVVLDAMDQTLAAPRETVAPHAPQVGQVTIPKRAIARLIGPGGRRIQELQAQTKTRVDVRDDGRVRVYAKRAEDLARALARIRDEGLELELGGIYTAEVVSIKEYGAFVRIGGHEGLVHISELEAGRVDKVEDVLEVGAEVRVRVLGADNKGRLELSRRAALDGGEDRAEAGAKD